MTWLGVRLRSVLGGAAASRVAASIIIVNIADMMLYSGSVLSFFHTAHMSRQLEALSFGSLIKPVSIAQFRAPIAVFAKIWHQPVEESDRLVGSGVTPASIAE
ncbi:hypothetical protein ACFPRL_36060 [Pseudoclavibacter helvolus]